MSGPHVVVVGGGLAGLAAALACADAGAAVTLLERRKRLGGLTWSFHHHDRWIDNGQHVFLRCCGAYLGFLERIGSAADVVTQARLDVTVLAPHAGPARLRRSRLPAPLHLAGFLARYRHLPLADRARLGRAAVALRGADLADDRLDSDTFAAWLAKRGQSPQAIGRLWNLITLPTVNLPADQASALVAAKVFQTGLLSRADAGDIGWSRVPLGVLHGERAAAALARAGVVVHTAQQVSTVRQSAAGFEVRSPDVALQADSVVVAVPHDQVARILPAGALPSQDGLYQLGRSPIVDVHLTYDRQITSLPFAAAIDSPAQWIFDRTAASGLGSSGGTGPQYLAVSVSAAEEFAGQKPAQLIDTMTSALADLFPAAREATVLDALVTREHAATFRAAPGSAALRPPATSALPGLFVAGAWTDTGWPATMEGAVRSGLVAAGHAMGQTSRAKPYRSPQFFDVHSSIPTEVT